MADAEKGSGAVFSENAEGENAERTAAENDEFISENGEPVTEKGESVPTEKTDDENKGADADGENIVGSEAKRGEASRRSIGEVRRALGAARAYSGFVEEASRLAEVYPSFDLASECEDPRFSAMLACGVDMRCAYEALHHEDIIKAAMQYAADRVYEASCKGLAGSAERPLENGIVASSGGIDPKKDVASLTAEDIKKILKRVERGEKIRF